MIDYSIQPEVAPALFFAEMWQLASNWSVSDRATANSPPDAFIAKLKRALALNSGQECAAGLRGLVNLTDKGQVIAAMREIDVAFTAIHPRARLMPAAMAARPLIPHWLAELRDLRRVIHCYCQGPNWRLIPRGPLARLPREEWDSNTDCLADRFSALNVAPLATDENARPITISCLVLDTGVLDGVPLGAATGAETVAFVPVAEEAGDLTTSTRTIGSNSFVRFQAKAGLAPERMMQALGLVGAVDIVVAPELVMDEPDAVEFSEGLTRLSTPPRLVVAGSGNTGECDTNGQSWNEAQVFNGAGTLLWRQRKIQLAGIKPDRTSALGLSAPVGGLLYEDNASGSDIVIFDADNLGRCVVLICQDIEASRLAEDIIRFYQPDWVFVPILDSGIDEGRWVHQRTFNLSGESHTRFLVACSTAIARQLNPKSEVHCGLAIGPKATTAPDTGRMYLLVAAKGKPALGTLTWRAGDWRKTKLTTEKS